MSKIIKAYENAEFVTFNFCEIEAAGVPLQPEISSADENTEPDPAQADPLDELEKTIQQRLLETERKTQEMEREAYEQGYAQGLKDGSEYGLKSMLIVKEHMEKLLSGLQALPEKAFKDYRDWFIAACIALSQIIVRKELDIHPEQLIRTIDALLEEVQGNHTLTLHLHPKDVDMLAGHTDFQEIMHQSGRSFVLKPDLQLERGGCRLESEIQLLDATMETQFALIEEAMLSHGLPADNPSS